MMANRLLSLDPRHADALISLAHVERGAFSGGIGKFAQYRFHDIVYVERSLVTRPQPPGRTRETPSAIRPLGKIVVQRKRTGETQHGGAVKTRAAAQFCQ